MPQYNIRPDGFKEIRKKMLYRIVPIMVIAVAFGSSIAFINSSGKADIGTVLPIFIPFILLVMGFSIYRAIKQQQKLYDSYTLTLNDREITRYQVNTPTITIQLNEVSEIVKKKDGGFTVRGKSARDLIIIPAEIEDYNVLESTLNGIKPASAKISTPFLQKYSILTSILTIGLMVCVYTVMNKVIVAISGTVLLTLMIWSLYDVQQNKNIDARTRRSSWISLIVIISVLAVMIAKLSR